MMAVMIVEQVQDGHCIPSLVAIVVIILAHRHVITCRTGQGGYRPKFQWGNG